MKKVYVVGGIAFASELDAAEFCEEYGYDKDKDIEKLMLVERESNVCVVRDSPTSVVNCSSNDKIPSASQQNRYR